MSGGTLLLVEDSPFIRDAFSILLEDAGYAVLQAPDGARALALAAADPRPDLVLLDMGLPDMGGLDVVRRLKADPATAPIPVVAVTGRDEDAERNACIASGCAAYLIKPIDTQRLIRDIPGYIAGA